MILGAKLLLLWLLMLAIPLQGVAAVLQAGCAPAAMMNTPAANTHGADSMHSMHDMRHDRAYDLVRAAAERTPIAHAAHEAGSSCSSCATCSVGAMLPTALASPATPDLPAPRYLMQPSAGWLGFTPENPAPPPALA